MVLVILISGLPNLLISSYLFLKYVDIVSTYDNIDLGICISSIVVNLIMLVFCARKILKCAKIS